MDTEKKIVLITGGTKGIGKAVAEELSSDFEVITIGRSSTAVEQGDLKDIKFRESLYEKYTPDIFINNAAALYHDPYKMVEMNSTVPIELLMKFYEKMPTGSIINIGSISAERLNRPKELLTQIAYSTSKRMLKDMSLALNYSKNKPVKVMCLSPSATDTPMLSKLTDYQPNQDHYDNYDWEKSICWTKPEDIAKIIRWMLSMPPYINIPEIVIDNHYSQAFVW
jgi:NADP-dependent 3-hydroxy acid dehydrogenase YdfG